MTNQIKIKGNYSNRFNGFKRKKVKEKLSTQETNLMIDLVESLNKKMAEKEKENSKIKIPF